MDRPYNILKELSSNPRTKGKITLHNDGRYLARLQVNYKLIDQDLSQISERIYEGQTKSLEIPSKAYDIKIRVDELITGVPEIWKCIFKTTSPYAGKKSFRVWGNSLHARFGIINEKTANKIIETNV